MGMDTRKTRTRQDWRFYGRWLATAVIVLLFVKIAFTTVFAIRLNQTFQEIQTEAARVQRGEDLAISIPKLRANIRTADRQIRAVKLSAWPFPALAKTTQNLPGGRHPATAAHLLDIADRLIDTAVALDAQIDPLLFLSQSDNDSAAEQVQLMLKLLAQAAPELEQANEYLIEISHSRRQIGSALGLPAWLANPLQQLDAIMPQLDQLVLAGQAIPELLGSQEPHHVLVLLQNADELRPTGGFITYSAYFVFENGEIIGSDILSSTDSAIDQFERRFYGPPPAPFSQYMELRLWLFRDANWSPDFPTSAAQAATFYTYGRDLPVDTVIALNQYTIQEIMATIGPTAGPNGEIISAETIIPLLQDSWTEGRTTSIEDRKLFIAELGPTLIEHIRSSITFQTARQQLKTLNTVGAQRDIMIYSTDPAIQRWSEVANFDGQVASGPSDYIFAVSTNMGYNKTDLNMSRQMEYQVSLVDIQAPYSVLSITHTNFGDGAADLCQPEQLNRLSTTYRQQATGCNVNYLRLYVPNDTNFVSLPAFPIPSSYAGVIRDNTAGQFKPITDERQKAIAAGLMITPPQSNNEARFIYQLQPHQIFSFESGNSMSYKLLIQKQGGAPAQPVRVTVDLPADYPLTAVSHTPTALGPNTVTFDLLLDKDIELKLNFAITQSQQDSIGFLLRQQALAPLPTPGPRLVPTRLPVIIE